MATAPPLFPDICLIKKRPTVTCVAQLNCGRSLPTPAIDSDATGLSRWQSHMKTCRRASRQRRSNGVRLSGYTDHWEEYQLLAAECRTLANCDVGDDARKSLLHMADMWDALGRKWGSAYKTVRLGRTGQSR